MNKAVELINEWGAFEEKYPDGTIEDFCRHYLISKRENQPVEIAGGIRGIHTDGLLLRLIGRIAKLNMVYAQAALAGTGLIQIEEFGLLVVIKQEKNPRKTDIIHTNIQELSSGTDMLARLLKRGLIVEYTDEEDKRSKRVKLTEKGENAFMACIQNVGRMAKMMLNDMPEDDKRLCIQLLKSVDAKFSKLWFRHKGLPFDEIYEDVMGGAR